ncbi:hypothetical protein [Brevundimonas aurantiaca]|uniref:hypothetical protein n=1 Tax=Brevundimonas aurantiaca TaxID=74316 RepID=UPI001603D637|nr:hypothetical protein [Pseudomonas sp. FW305-3-2-15-E-TSA4]
MARAGVTAAQVLADPAASYALKAVLVAWRRRDPVDAANDARLLRDVLEGAADQRLGGRHDDR